MASSFCPSRFASLSRPVTAIVAAALFAVTLSLAPSAPAQTIPTTLTLTATPAASASTRPAVLVATLGPYETQAHTTNGQIVTFFTGGAPSMASNPVSSLVYGYDAFGDSNTAGAGYSPSYPAMLSSQFSPTGAPFNNFGISGYDCRQQNYAMFIYLNPQDSGNPVVSDMIGTNDEGSLTGGPTQQLAFVQCQFAANAHAALSASNTVMAGSSQVQATGSWTVDPTFFAFNGLSTTTSNSSLSATVDLPSGLLYLWYESEGLQGGGAFQVSIDGVSATDTLSSLSTIPTGLGGYGNAVYVARYVTTPGRHNVTATVTSASSSSNPVEIYAFGAPPKPTPTGATGPFVYLGGVMHYENDPNDTAYPGLGIANSINRQVATALDADGLNVHFVDVRSYVDPVLGMLSSPQGNCLASWNPGFHVNNCGTQQLEQAFADAMGLNTATSSPQPIGTATLSSGVATLALTSLPPGVNSITAVYAGDPDFAAASSISSFVRVPQPAPAVTWNPPGGSVYTGQPIGTGVLNASCSAPSTLTYTASLNGSSPVPITATSILSAGVYSLTATCTPASPASSVSTSSTFTLSPAPLTITSASVIRPYGSPNPPLTATVTGGLNGDTFNAIAATSATILSSVGIYPITYTVTGAKLANYSVVSGSATLTITPAGSSTSFALSNQDLTLTAAVVSLTSGTPTGSVAFYAGSTLLGSVPLSGGSGAYTVSSLPSGSVPLTAQYMGDGNFMTSASAPTVALSVTSAASSLTITQAGIVADLLTVSAAPGYTGAVALACAGLPANASCSFQTPSVVFAGVNAPTPVTLTIHTGVPPIAMVPAMPFDSRFSPIRSAILWIPGLFAAAGRKRKTARLHRLFLFAVLCAVVITLTGCGVSTSAQTPAGTSTVQIIASGPGGLTETSTVTLTVQ